MDIVIAQVFYCFPHAPMVLVTRPQQRRNRRMPAHVACRAYRDASTARTATPRCRSCAAASFRLQQRNATGTPFPLPATAQRSWWPSSAQCRSLRATRVAPPARTIMRYALVCNPGTPSGPTRDAARWGFAFAQAGIDGVGRSFYRAVSATASVGSTMLVSQSGGSSSRHLTPSGAKTRSTVPPNS